MEKNSSPCLKPPTRDGCVFDLDGFILGFVWIHGSPLLVGKQHGEIPQNVGIELEDLVPVIQ